MPRAKPGQRFGGRQKGTPNRSTLQRRLLAEAALAGGRGDKEIAVDVLERMMRLAEGAAGYHRPISEETLSRLQEQENARAAAAGEPPRTLQIGGSWPMFGEWVDRVIHCAKELAKYQSPTYKAIAVAAAMPETAAQTIENLSSGERQAPATYLRLVKG